MSFLSWLISLVSPASSRSASLSFLYVSFWNSVSPLSSCLFFLLWSRFPSLFLPFLFIVVPLPSQGPSGISITLPEQVMAQPAGLKENLCCSSVLTLLMQGQLYLCFSYEHLTEFKIFPQQRLSRNWRSPAPMFKHLQVYGNGVWWAQLHMTGHLKTMSFIFFPRPCISLIWYFRFSRRVPHVTLGAVSQTSCPLCVLRRTKIPFPGGFWNCAR